MKIRKFIVLLAVFTFSLFHFSPQITNATEKVTETEVVKGEEENVEDLEELEDSVDYITDAPEHDLIENNEPLKTEIQGEVELEEKDENNDFLEEEQNNETKKETKENLTIETDQPDEQELQKGEAIENSVPEDSVILKNGVRDGRVIELKINLGKLGFPVPGNGTNYFGASTETKVSEFQSYYGLTVNGIADEATLFKLEEVLSSPLQTGNRHEATVQLKLDLAKAGYPIPGNGTTLYGASTENSVKGFQKRYGLVQNGIADEVTLSKLEEILNAPLSNGIYRNDVPKLKADLQKVGFRVPGNGTPLYGTSTETKVSEFQSYYGLTVNGIADEATLFKLEEVLSSPLQTGNRHEATVQLKLDLAKAGYPVPGKGTTFYGTSTEGSVKGFQKRHGLVENGIADEVTLAKLEEILNAPLSNGLYREDVSKLKSDLEKVGFRVPGKGTPLYGNSTETKVSEFQSYYGLTVNGIADETTLSKLKEILSSPLQNGKRNEATIQLKIDLAKLGFQVSGKGTNLYGSGTEQKVKEFQSYYGLAVSGIADEVTLSKLEEILSSPLQNGRRHEDTVQLKANLAKLGFKVPGNGTNLYGSSTETKVSEFQSYYGLVVSGIADEVTLSKLEEVLSSPLKNGKRNAATVQLKSDLSKLGFKVPGNGTTLYGSGTEQKVREFQSYYGLVSNGIGDEVTLGKIKEILSSPFQSGKRHKDTIQLKKDLAKLGYTVSNKPTTLYGTQTEKQIKSFQKDYGLPISGIADAKTFKKIATEAKKIKENTIKIFLDPGHGAHDPGGSAYGLQEKSVVLDIALRTAEILTTKYIGVEVKLSRTTDKFIELTERAQIANTWGADYFVSFHTNAFNGTASGFESFVYNGAKSQETKNRQKDIHNYLVNKMGISDRGIKEANFSVLRNTNMPAILLEYMFIDNAAENALLKQSSYRDWLGQITAEAIAHSFNLKKK